MNRRGFTLVEMMIAVIVSAGTVVLAAKVAQVVTSQTIKGQATTETHNRSALVIQQIRTDLQLAGYGSTGLISVSPGQFGGMTLVTSPGGFPAIPAVVGANNVGATGVAGATVQAGSDLIQMVVPDPGSLVRVTVPAVEGAAVLDTDAQLNCAPNRFVYIVDHSRFNGMGRTQIAPFASATPTNATIGGVTTFTVALGSEVMCARISTYWVDDTNRLLRSDLQPGGAYQAFGAGVHIDTGVPVANTVVSPGVADLQAAYRLSAAAYSASYGGPGVPLGATFAQKWAFEGGGGGIEGTLAAATPVWAEVRQVELQLFTRTLRRGVITTVSVQDLVANRALDAAGVAYGVAPNSRALTYEWETAAESLVNLRYFDKAAHVDSPAEPI